MKKSGTVIRRDQSDSPAARHLPLVDILVEALTPLYVKTRVQAAWMSFWRARKSVMTRW